MSYLSFASHCTLIIAALTHLALYYMSFFSVPKIVITEIEKMQRQFLWWGNSEQRKHHWVKWVHVYKSKYYGGLGTGRLEHRNKALLFKWVWRLGSERNSLWRRALCSKYAIDTESPWWPTAGSPHYSYFMRSIYTLLTTKFAYKSIINEGLCLALGNGAHIRLWQDCWLANEPLRIKYPRIYALSNNIFGLISSFGNWVDSFWSWRVVLRRPLFEWETEQWDNFLFYIN